MSSTETIPVGASAGSYTIFIADTGERVRAAQRLRRQVYTAEFGADLCGPAGLDIDEFDELCDHLIVEHQPSGSVVGTYRLLPPGRSRELYSAGEFDLGRLDPLTPSMVELGRSCVHPDHRGGAVINLMWSALARYALLAGCSHLAGCGSVSLTDGGRASVASRADWEACTLTVRTCARSRTVLPR